MREFDDIGSDVRNTVGLENINEKTGAHHGNGIKIFFMVEFFQKKINNIVLNVIVSYHTYIMENNIICCR